MRRVRCAGGAARRGSGRREAGIMAYKDAMDAIELRMPRHIPRTEYSASSYWPLVARVTGIPVGEDSAEEEKKKAASAFEKAWDFGLNWSTLVFRDALTGPRTSMGHAAYRAGGADVDRNVACPFKSAREVLLFDPFEAYGARDIGALVRAFDEHYRRNCLDHPGQVNMTGIYITMMSGFIEIFGWTMLLEGLAEDADEFGRMADRYAEWIGQYFKALALCSSPVVMVHDDIVWTSGPFVQPSWYRKYIFPNYEKLFEPLHRAGKKVLFTSDGTYDAFVDDIASCGVNGFVMEPTTDMAGIARRYGRTHAIVGNADCRILSFGDRDDIRREVERCMTIGRDCPGFIMAVGNHLAPSVPVENALYYNECYLEMADRR